MKRLLSPQESELQTEYRIANGNSHLSKYHRSLIDSYVCAGNCEFTLVPISTQNSIQKSNIVGSRTAASPHINYAYYFNTGNWNVPLIHNDQQITVRI